MPSPASLAYPLPLAPLPALPSIPLPMPAAATRADALAEGPRHFAVLNFGCKANAWDGQLLRERLQSAGLTETDPETPGHPVPDLLVINSCTVTDTADRTAVAVLRKLRRQFPAAQFVATGCMADISPAEMLAAAPAATDAAPTLRLPTHEKSPHLVRLGPGGYLRGAWVEATPK